MLSFSVYTSWVCLAVAFRDVTACFTALRRMTTDQIMSGSQCFSNCRSQQAINFYDSNLTCEGGDKCTVECGYDDPQPPYKQVILNDTSPITRIDRNTLRVSISKSCVNGHLDIVGDGGLSWSEMRAIIEADKAPSECKCVACTHPPNTCHTSQCWSFYCTICISFSGRPTTTLLTPTEDSASSSLVPPGSNTSIKNQDDWVKATVLVTVGCALAVIIAASIISLIWFLRRRKRKRQNSGHLSDKETSRSTEVQSSADLRKQIPVENHAHNYVDCETSRIIILGSQSTIKDKDTNPCRVITGNTPQNYDQIFEGIYTLAKSMSETPNTEQPPGHHDEMFTKEETTKTDNNADPAGYGITMGTSENPQNEVMEDQYDHVKRVLSDGMDGGEYDVLQRQHVRYTSPAADNEYDHC